MKGKLSAAKSVRIRKT